MVQLIVFNIAERLKYRDITLFASTHTPYGETNQTKKGLGDRTRKAHARGPSTSVTFNRDADFTGDAASKAKHLAEDAIDDGTLVVGLNVARGQVILIQHVV